MGACRSPIVPAIASPSRVPPSSADRPAGVFVNMNFGGCWRDRDGGGCCEGAACALRRQPWRTQIKLPSV